jgi:hypothetical protein
MIKTRSQFKARSVANNVEIIIPVPPDVDSPSFKSAVGNVTYLPDKDAIVWNMKQLHGGREFIMRAHFGLPSISATDVTKRSSKKDVHCQLSENSWKAPIVVKFEIRRNKKSPRNSMRIFAHTYYANDLGEPMAIKSSTQMYLDNAWDKWHDLQLEGWTFEELELPESV